MEKISFVLLVGILLVSSIGLASAGLESNINDCGTLDQANTVYTLTGNIDKGMSSNCMIISAPNITLDCDGYYIKSDNSYTGIYSDQVDTTIKNCNVSMGGQGGSWGIELYHADNSYVHDNILNSQSCGLVLFSTDNARIESITAFSNEQYGIYLSGSSDNILTDINANSNQLGIYLSGSSDNILTDINANSNQLGIKLVSNSDNNTLTNIAASSFEKGIYLSSSSDNILTNITTNSAIYQGLHLASNSNNNQLTDITSNSNLRGVLLLTSSNNNLTNIVANSNTIGIEISTASNNNRFNDVTISSSVARGIYMTSDNNNNIFKEIISESNGVWGIYLVDSNDNNTFIDGNLSGNTPGDVFFGGVVDNLANTFLNITYASEEVSSGTLIRSWYYRAYVNDSVGNAVINANVSGYDVDGALQFISTTGSDGWTDYIKVTDYINSLSIISYNPYTIHVNKATYKTSIHEKNLIKNMDDSFQLIKRGDSNYDGKVDGADLAIWQQNYDPIKQNDNTFEMGDWNEDGRIDGADLAIWQQNYDPIGLSSSESEDEEVIEEAGKEEEENELESTKRKDDKRDDKGTQKGVEAAGEETNLITIMKDMIKLRRIENKSLSRLWKIWEFFRKLY